MLEIGGMFVLSHLTIVFTGERLQHLHPGHGTWLRFPRNGT